MVVVNIQHRKSVPLFYTCILLKTLHVTLQYVFWFCWTLGVSRTASYEITLVRLSVCVSVGPSFHPFVSNFFQYWIIAFFCLFSDILHDDSWPWYLVTDETIFLKNKNGGTSVGPTCVNQAQSKVFPHFVEFGSYVFLETEYDDSLRQYLISIRSKIHEKTFGAQISAKQAQIELEIRFLAIFSSLVH